MKTRCFNSRSPKYPDYGGRGITMCDRWRRDFKAFLADMGLRPSAKHCIERVDNDGNYEPGNCRWATYRDQARNKRTTAYVVLDGRRVKCLDAADALGITSRTLAKRARVGLDAKTQSNQRIPNDVASIIRQRYALGGTSQAALADEFFLSQQTISRLVRGLSYRYAVGPTKQNGRAIRHDRNQPRGSRASRWR